MNCFSLFHSTGITLVKQTSSGELNAGFDFNQDVYENIDGSAPGTSGDKNGDAMLY